MLSLAGLAETRPAQTGGVSTVTITAKVTSGGQPKAGVTVGLSVDVFENSGGHDHDNAARPKGQLMPEDGVTDANGEVKIVFQAPAFAGTHVVAASCIGCSSATSHTIDVKVPGLVALRADASVPPTYTLRGSDDRHTSNHWFSASARMALIELIDVFNDLGWKPVGVNDAGLKWGGRFDIKGNWAGSHAEHSIGEEVDLSFAVGTNAERINDAYDEFCVEKNVDMPSTILWHDIPLNQGGKYPPHFHVRLDGKYTNGRSAGKPAPCSRDSLTKKK
jgi:hypothetical protein